jgi:hypothetical protein
LPCAAEHALNSSTAIAIAAVARGSIAGLPESEP